jgi:alpha-glucosidase
MPRASYGVWYSGCCISTLYTQDAVNNDILQQYYNRDLPLDVLVLDFFWHRPGWGGYSWNKKLFPDSVGLVQSLRNGSNPYSQPLKLLLNHHPDQATISAQTEDRYDAFATAMGVDPKENRSFACNFYDQKYMTALQTALLDPIEDYAWIDCVACAVHAKCGDAAAPANLDFNLMANYALNTAIAKKNKRAITLNRLPGRGDTSNYNVQALNGSKLQGNLGARRYPGAWTGDLPCRAAPCTDLSATVELFAAAAAGHLWTGYSQDLGPYIHEHDPLDDAKFVRYMQFGAFSPIFRPHDGGNMDTRIWMFNEPFASILADYTRLRGALTPYTYSLAERTYATSWPFIRPMWWDYPAVVQAWELPSQYMFGQLLVRPITGWANISVLNTTVDTATVFLPANSTWLSWDGSSVTTVPPATEDMGGIWINATATLAQIPLYVAAGAVLPMWPPGRRESEPPTRVWAVWVKGGSRGSGSLYEDDGDTLDYRTSTPVAQANSRTNVEYTLKQHRGRAVDGEHSGKVEAGDENDGRVEAGDENNGRVEAGDENSGRVGGGGVGTHQLAFRIAPSTGGYIAKGGQRRIDALQLRGVDVKAMASSTRSFQVMVNGTALPQSKTSGNYTQPGWWVQPAPGEMACPSGTVVVVCPRRRASEGVLVEASW